MGGPDYGHGVAGGRYCGERCGCRDSAFYLERRMAIGNFYSGYAFQVDAKDKHRARECASGGRGMGLALLGEGEMAPPRKRMCLR